MAFTPANKGADTRNVSPSVSISVTPTPAKHTTSPSLSKGPVYRSTKRGPQGQTIWVQGVPLQPVATATKMEQLAKDHARDAWRRQFQHPANHVERSPAEHRAAVAALNSVDVKKAGKDVFSLALNLRGGV